MYDSTPAPLCGGLQESRYPPRKLRPRMKRLVLSHRLPMLASTEVYKALFDPRFSLNFLGYPLSSLSFMSGPCLPSTASVHFRASIRCYCYDDCNSLMAQRDFLSQYVIATENSGELPPLSLPCSHAATSLSSTVSMS